MTKKDQDKKVEITIVGYDPVRGSGHTLTYRPDFEEDAVKLFFTDPSVNAVDVLLVELFKDGNPTLTTGPLRASDFGFKPFGVVTKTPTGKVLKHTVHAQDARDAAELGMRKASWEEKTGCKVSYLTEQFSDRRGTWSQFIILMDEDGDADKIMEFLRDSAGLNAEPGEGQEGDMDGSEPE